MNYLKINEEIHQLGVELIVVSKNRTIDEIQQIYDQGHRDFGENRVQELVKKYEHFPKDIRWHLIGSLQKNKIKHIVPFVYLIHSVDSIDLLEQINHSAEIYNKTIKVLLEIKLGQEPTKQGFDIEQVNSLVREYNWKKLNNISVVGIMGMATFTEDENVISSEFQTLKQLFIKLKNDMKDQCDLSILSMGMSQDYKIAIQHGATHVRIGTSIFE